MPSNTTYRVHVLRAGCHRDARGRTVDLSAADIAELAESYDPALHRAPLVKGHPEHDLPAYGCVERAQAVDGHLFAEVAPVPELAEDVRQGRLLGVSAALYGRTHPNNPTPGKLHLRHLGFTGAVPPAIKGLEAPQFDEGDALHEEYFEFAESPSMDTIGFSLDGIADLLRGVREQLIADKGIAQADMVLPAWKLDSIGRCAEVLRRQPPPGPSRPNPDPNPSSIFTEVAMTETDIQALRSRNSALETEIQQLRQQAAAAQAAQMQTDHAAFCETLIAERRLLPRNKAATLGMLGHLARTSEGAEFGEGGSKTTPLEAYKASLRAQPQITDALFSESASRQSAASAKHAAGEKHPLVADAEARAAR